jgi:esterase/lipase superfamily enzyme
MSISNLFLGFRRSLSFLALLLVAVPGDFFCTPGAFGLDKQTIWKVPVLYVTDRQSQKNTFGPRRLLEKNTVARVESGIVEVCVQQDRTKALADWQKTAHLGRANSMEPPKVNKFNCQTSDDLKGEFNAGLNEALERTSKKEVFVFIHGFNNSFNVAAANAARLSFYTGCPVILYSWPSAGKLYRYSVDECNNEWSQEHFNQLLEHLLSLKRSQGLQCNMVAHSMGNRLFVRAVTVYSGTGLFKDIYMVNPDFDAQTFIHYLSRYMPPTGLVSGVRAQLLVSRKDNALSVAEGLFGGYTRLGQGVDFTLSALTSPQSFGGVWAHHADSLLKSSQQDADTDAKVVESIRKVFRVFDVTALDHGMLGHKVPHEFIAWMHFRNQAPPGFEIKLGQSKGLNRLSRFFARSQKQNIKGSVGECSIVTRSNPGEDVSVHRPGGL